MFKIGDKVRVKYSCSGCIKEQIYEIKDHWFDSTGQRKTNSYFERIR